MKITFDILSGGAREDWALLPARLDDRAAGLARVKFREIPRTEWDRLYLARVAALQAAADLGLAYAQELRTASTLPPAERTAAIRALNERYDPRFRESMKECRTATQELLSRVIVDHDPKYFEAEAPADPKLHPAFAESLRGLGYAEEEIEESLRTGRAYARFRGATFTLDTGHGTEEHPGCSEATFTLYRRCQPKAAFLDVLVAAAKRFIDCEELSPEVLWTEHEGPEKKEGAPEGEGPLE